VTPKQPPTEGAYPVGDNRRLTRRERRRRDEQRVLASLIKWAQDRPHGPGYAAGPTTDPATVADRILRGGRIKVKTKGVPQPMTGFWNGVSHD
jgi:hypothetical protein